MQNLYFWSKIEMLTGIITVILLIIGVLLTRSFTVLVHEFGHALPALLFTDKEVEVYVGSYGNISNSLIFRTGRLTIYLTFNVLDWNIGMCRNHGDISIAQNIIIVLGGPIASVLLSIPLIMIYQTEGLSDVWRFLIPIFVGSAVLDFFVNIIPMSSPLRLHDGSISYNDGQQLLMLLFYANAPKGFLDAVKLFQNEEYEKALSQFKEFLKVEENKLTHNFIIQCLMAQRKYREALQYFEKMAQQFNLKTDDFSLLGELHFKLRNLQEALKYLNKALHKSPNNAEDLALRGLIFIHFEDYQEASFDLNNAVRLANTFVDAYANRGLLHIKLNQLDAAKWDIDKALSLNENYAPTYLYLGFWYEAKGDFVSNKNALAAFQKAKELGVEEANLDWIIAEAERKINFNS